MVIRVFHCIPGIVSGVAFRMAHRDLSLLHSRSPPSSSNRFVCCFLAQKWQFVASYARNVYRMGSRYLPACRFERVLGRPSQLHHVGSSGTPAWSSVCAYVRSAMPPPCSHAHLSSAVTHGVHVVTKVGCRIALGSSCHCKMGTSRLRAEVVRCRQVQVRAAVCAAGGSPPPH